MRTSSSLLFALTLTLSFALLAWWTTFLVMASNEVAEAGVRLADADLDGAARALGATDVPALTQLASRRRWMFVSEGAFFAVVLLACGWLYLASVRRETALRAHQDRFLAAATHELKTPLATIVLLLESLRDGRLPPQKLPRYLNNGLLEAERLERGLHNVLTAAGLRSAGKPMRRDPGDLAEDLELAVESLRARADAADIQLQLDACGPLSARRDAAALQLVLRNLIDNAIKFSPAGSTVRVALEHADGEARITVRDQGRGLDQSELQHAFEPFWRGDDRASGGAGLGLHLVHELVLGHGGSVRADSAGRDQGSVFTVRLPLEVAS
ncbi:MAG: HAMP domain-containing sensor histidine kinase [Planctomycetota bacterium]